MIYVTQEQMFNAMASYDNIDETVREIAAYIIQNGTKFQGLYDEMCMTGDVEVVLNNNGDILQNAFDYALKIKPGLGNSKKLSNKFNLDPLATEKIDLGKFGIDSNKGTDLTQIVKANYTQYKNNPANGDTKPTIAQLIDSSLAGAVTIPESEKAKALADASNSKSKPSVAPEILVEEPPAGDDNGNGNGNGNGGAGGDDDIKQKATAILNDINKIDSPDPAVANLKNQASQIHKDIMDGLVINLDGLTGILTQIQTLVNMENPDDAAPAPDDAAPEVVDGAGAGAGAGNGKGNGNKNVHVHEHENENENENENGGGGDIPVGTTLPTNDTDHSPQVVDIETDYPDVVEFIRRAQMSKSQGDHLIDMANYALNDPSGDRDTIELASAVRNFGPSSVDVIYDRLDMINPTLGHKVTPYKPTRNIKFSKPTMMQSSRTRSVSTGLVTPEGFGTSINSNIWNKPVITEFGFPFLNISSEAITLLFKSKGETQQAAYKKFKSMLKTAVKTYGGIWKAIYKAPLDVLKQFANDPGTRCVANMLKVDGNDLLGSDFESTVTVTPIDYYSVDASYNQPTPVPREYLTSFYTVLDYTQADRATYLQYADGMTANDFVEETSQNNGIPPFYLLVPKSGSFSKCELKPTGVIGSFINLFSSAKNCILLKTYFNKRKGCFLMEKQVADALYADLQ